MYSLLAIAQRLEVLKDFRLFFARVIGSQLGQWFEKVRCLVHWGVRAAVPAVPASFMTEANFAFPKKERWVAKRELLWSTRCRAVSERHQNYDSALNTISQSGFRAANLFLQVSKRSSQLLYTSSAAGGTRFWTAADWSHFKTGASGGSNNNENSYFAWTQVNKEIRAGNNLHKLQSSYFCRPNMQTKERF